MAPPDAVATELENRGGTAVLDTNGEEAAVDEENGEEVVNDDGIEDAAVDDEGNGEEAVDDEDNGKEAVTDEKGEEAVDDGKKGEEAVDNEPAYLLPVLDTGVIFKETLDVNNSPWSFPIETCSLVDSSGFSSSISSGLALSTSPSTS